MRTVPCKCQRFSLLGTVHLLSGTKFDMTLRSNIPHAWQSLNIFPAVPLPTGALHQSHRSASTAKHHKSLAGSHRSQWSQFVSIDQLEIQFQRFLDLYIQSGSQRKCTMVDDHSKLQSISIVYVTWNVEPKPSNQGTNLANMKKLAMLAMLLFKTLNKTTEARLNLWEDHIHWTSPWLILNFHGVFDLVSLKDLAESIRHW